MKLSEYSLIERVQAEIDGVTQENLDAVTQNLPPVTDTDKPLGIVHADYLRRLYHVRQATSVRCNALGQLAATLNGDEKKRVGVEAHKTHMMHELADNLFWDQLRIEMNFWDGPIGVRADWMAIERPDDDDDDAPKEMPKSIQDAIRNALQSTLGPSMEVEVKSMSSLGDFMNVILGKMLSARLPQPPKKKEPRDDGLEALFREDDPDKPKEEAD